MLAVLETSVRNIVRKVTRVNGFGMNIVAPAEKLSDCITALCSLVIISTGILTSRFSVCM